MSEPYDYDLDDLVLVMGTLSDDEVIGGYFEMVHDYENGIHDVDPVFIEVVKTNILNRGYAYDYAEKQFNRIVVGN